jgi:hypothetical protein
MRTVFIVMAIGSLALHAVAAEAQQPRECQFSIMQAAPTPGARGSEDFLSRLRFVRQPDAPVVVTAIDFGNATLTVGEGNYAVSYVDGSIELLNVSDRPVSDIHLMVHTRWMNLSGTGSSVKSTGLLRPGQRIRLDMRGGRGQGTSPSADKLTVDVLVESVQIDGCLYRPSQTLPQGF